MSKEHDEPILPDEVNDTDLPIEPSADVFVNIYEEQEGPIQASAIDMPAELPDTNNRPLMTEDASQEMKTDDEISPVMDNAPAQTDLVTENVVIRRLGTETTEKSSETKPKEKGMLYSFLDTLRFISLGLVIGILLVIFVIQRNDVYGESMAPTLHNGDAVFVEMITSYTTSYERGDIVTIYATGMEGYDKKEKLIKRIIAGPNDTVSIRDGEVYVNDIAIDEPYLVEDVPTYCNEESKANGYDNITLKEGEYYCLGDNRGASLDSRILGPIPVDRIKAHVIIKIFPFSDMKTFQ